MHFDSRIKKACRSTQHLQIHFHFSKSPSKAFIPLLKFEIRFMALFILCQTQHYHCFISHNGNEWLMEQYPKWFMTVALVIFSLMMAKMLTVSPLWAYCITRNCMDAVQQPQIEILNQVWPLTNYVLFILVFSF